MLLRFNPALLLLLLVTLVLSGQSIADPQSKSFSHWRISENSIQATFTIASREATRLPAYQNNSNLAAVFSEHLVNSMQLNNAAKTCSAVAPMAQRAKAGYLQYALTFNCPTPITEIDIAITTLMQAAPSHIHFAKFTIDKQPPFEQLFTRRKTQHHINLQVAKTEETITATNNSNGETLVTYTLFGFEHILIGADHIAFLLTLMLLANRVRDIIFIVTGFTLGHSITLSLATLGIATPDTLVVEALIGFTVALVAIENISAQSNNAKNIATLTAAALGLLTLFTAISGIGPPLYSLVGLTLFSYCFLRLSNTEQKARTMRPAVTSCFGLIHGFGFANVLMEVGLPEQRILPALFGFNIGVELGQIAIVLVLTLIGLLLKKIITGHQQLMVECLSSILCGVGVFWFMQRAYF